jgi:hypothetical protein
MSQKIPAHFDGEHILLDEPVELEPNAKLLVTVLPKDVERAEWLSVSLKRLQAAYEDGEEEYSFKSIAVEACQGQIRRHSLATVFQRDEVIGFVRKEGL